MLMKQAILNMYLDIFMWLDILRASELIKCFYLVMIKHTQLCLNQSDSKITEIPVIQFLVTELIFCIWVYIHRSYKSM